MAPTDKQWQRRGCSLKEGMCSLFLLTVIFGLPLLLWHVKQDQDNVTKRKLLFELPEQHMMPENAWYAAMKVAARKITNESCYACAQLPQGVGTSLPLKTIPLNTSETLGVMLAFTLGVPSKNRDVRDLTDQLNISVVNYGGSTARFWDMSVVTEQEVHQPVMTINPTEQIGNVCFSRECFMAEDHYLGISTCKQKVMWDDVGSRGKRNMQI